MNKINVIIKQNVSVVVAQYKSELKKKLNNDSLIRLWNHLIAQLKRTDYEDNEIANAQQDEHYGFKFFKSEDITNG